MRRRRRGRSGGRSYRKGFGKGKRAAIRSMSRILPMRQRLGRRM